MRIQNRKKFVARISELIILLVTIILTIVSINYANQVRTHKGYGGERLIPLAGMLIIMIIEENVGYGNSRKVERH